MRTVVQENEGIDASASWTGDPLPTDYLTTCGLSVTVASASTPVGAVTLQGSNQKPPSYIMQTQFEPDDDTWFDVPDSGIQVSANGTVGIAVAVSYRYVRAKYTRVSGSATLAIRLDLKGND